MSKPKFDLCEYPATDTLTGETTQKSVCLTSGARVIFIGIDTIRHLVNFLKTKEIMLESNA